jgi:hypothetical protein
MFCSELCLIGLTLEGYLVFEMGTVIVREMAVSERQENLQATPST